MCEICQFLCFSENALSVMCEKAIDKVTATRSITSVNNIWPVGVEIWPGVVQPWNF